MNYLASGTQDAVHRGNKITAYSSTPKRRIETSVLTLPNKYIRADKTISPLNTRDECCNSFKTVFSLQYITSHLLCIIACSKRSDSGERCEVKKEIKSRGGLSPSLAFIFRAPFYFAPLPTI